MSYAIRLALGRTLVLSRLNLGNFLKVFSGTDWPETLLLDTGLFLRRNLQTIYNYRGVATLRMTLPWDSTEQAQDVWGVGEGGE